MLVLRNYEFLIHFAGTFQSSSGESLVPICDPSLASACKAQLRIAPANWSVCLAFVPSAGRMVQVQTEVEVAEILRL